MSSRSTASLLRLSTAPPGILPPSLTIPPNPSTKLFQLVSSSAYPMVLERNVLFFCDRHLDENVSTLIYARAVTQRPGPRNSAASRDYPVLASGHTHIHWATPPGPGSWVHGPHANLPIEYPQPDDMVFRWVVPRPYSSASRKSEYLTLINPPQLVFRR
jgi:hypothetical protein